MHLVRRSSSHVLRVAFFSFFFSPKKKMAFLGQTREKKKKKKKRQTNERRTREEEARYTHTHTRTHAHARTESARRRFKKKMTVDFLARKQSKKNAKRLASLNKKGENERRNRAKRGRNRNTIGMCNFPPPLPPALAEEDEQREAELKMKKRKMERERLAAKAMRKKVKMEMERKISGEEEEEEEEEEGRRKKRDGEKRTGGSDESGESESDEKEKQENQSNNVPEYFIDAMKTIGHRRVAPIQKSSWAALCGNSDCLSVAPPGSGKTLAFLLPAFDVVIKRVAEFMSSSSGKKYGSNNINNSRKNVIDGLIVAPTRELAQQIASVGNKLKRAAPVKLVCMVGGTNQQEQEESLLAPTKLGVLVVGTPGRLCATVCFNAGGTKKSDDGSGKSIVVQASENRLGECKIFILDEADRMLALGFEPQLEQLYENLPKERQTALFSATFPAKVKQIARKWLKKDYAKVTLSANAVDISAKNADKGKEELVQRASKVIQTVHVCAEHKKSRKLMKYVDKLRKEDGRARSRVLVFTNRIKTVKFVKDLLVKHGEKVSTLHGEMRQDKRELALKDFKAGKTPILVATDVAGRGLDVAGLECVVNWDFPGSIEQYQHRIGRAGRNEKVGSALSFFTRKFAPLAKDLIELLANAKQFVDPNLKILAKAAEALPELENKFRDKFGNGDEPVDEHGEEDDDDDGNRGREDAEEQEEEDKKGTKSNKKNKKAEEENDGGDDEFTVPKDKPSVGDGVAKKKKQPGWWEAGGSNASSSTPLFGKKKREEMKNPAMRDALRCGPDDEEIINAAKMEKKEKKEPKKNVPSKDKDASFIPSKKFTEAKVGFVFKKGKNGLGYYLDKKPKVTFKPSSTSSSKRKQNYQKKRKY